MSYRFNGTTGYVEFALAPFNGHVFGPFTYAFFLKRNALANHGIIELNPAAMTFPPYFGARFITGNTLDVRYDPLAGSGGGTYSSTSVWYLVALTKAAAPSNIIRAHYHDGTSWTHLDVAGGGVGTANMPAIVSTALFRVGRWENAGAGLNFLSADLVCIGIKKANSSDATVATLSRTDWSAWTGFGFDWLIGFDTSLTSGGVLQDQGSPGTGDETFKTGTSVVSDPPGWSWPGVAAPNSRFLAFT